MRPSSLCVCLSVASHISETSETITIKFDTVTASVMRMHHMLIILTFRPSLKVTYIIIMKLINVPLFQKLFKQCPSSCCKDSPTKG